MRSERGRLTTSLRSSVVAGRAFSSLRVEVATPDMALAVFFVSRSSTASFWCRGIKKGDTKVYSASLLSPAQAHAFLQSKASEKVAQAIQGGIHKGVTIPISYVLLKKKQRQFAVAGPIISYSNVVFAKLFRAASTVLNILLPAVYPGIGNFRLQTLPEILRVACFSEQCSYRYSPAAARPRFGGFFYQPAH